MSLLPDLLKKPNENSQMTFFLFKTPEISKMIIFSKHPAISTQRIVYFLVTTYNRNPSKKMLQSLFSFLFSEARKRVSISVGF